MGVLHDAELIPDVLGLPTYVVDTVIRRDLGNGIASIINCRKHNGLIVPQCEVVISNSRLLSLGQEAIEFALEVHRRQQMAQMAEACALRH